MAENKPPEDYSAGAKNRGGLSLQWRYTLHGGFRRYLLPSENSHSIIVCEKDTACVVKMKTEVNSFFVHVCLQKSD